ncbi:hypothetical protein JHW43_005828 [Diplocarpon mali]|nr:hypothetical protein JHW43_005828 [Diplocarpon mali]
MYRLPASHAWKQRPERRIKSSWSRLLPIQALLKFGRRAEAWPSEGGLWPLAALFPDSVSDASPTGLLRSQSQREPIVWQPIGFAPGTGRSLPRLCLVAQRVWPVSETAGRSSRRPPTSPRLEIGISGSCIKHLALGTASQEPVRGWRGLAGLGERPCQADLQTRARDFLPAVIHLSPAPSPGASLTRLLRAPREKVCLLMEAVRKARRAHAEDTRLGTRAGPPAVRCARARRPGAGGHRRINSDARCISPSAQGGMPIRASDSRVAVTSPCSTEGGWSKPGGEAHRWIEQGSSAYSMRRQQSNGLAVA